MSKPEIRFGDCETGSRCDVAVTMTNGHACLPVTYKAGKVAQFKVWPASGRLLPMQSVELVVSFVPNMLGPHAAQLVLALNAGAAYLHINVFGHSHKIGLAGGPGGGGGTRKVPKGGLLALPEHFDPKFIFKEPEEFHARAPPPAWKTLRRPMPDVPAWKKVPPPIPDGANPDMCTDHELEARARHRLRYAEYLKTQHRIHFEQQVMWENGPEFQLGLGADNTTDFDYQGFNLELGMRNVTGLRPPVLALPVADEPLYLKPEKEMEPRKRQIDADKLLHRKFAAVPANEKEGL